MTSPLTPEGARNWFTAFYAIAEKSTPITMVFILALMIFGYSVTKKEITRLREMNLTLFRQIEEKNTELLKLAMECYKQR